jgi:predicted kinase
MRIALPDPSLVMLCGPAGSGKSTFARKHFPETSIVSSDRCRAMIGDDESNLAVSRDAFDIFHRIIAARLRNGRLAVADSTALGPDARAELRQVGRRAGAPVILIVFDVGEATSVKQDEARDRRVGRPVIREQWERFQEALKAILRESYDQVVVLSEDDVRRASVEFVKGKRALTERGG